MLYKQGDVVMLMMTGMTFDVDEAVESVGKLMVDGCDRDGSELLFNDWYREGGCGGKLNDGKCVV